MKFLLPLFIFIFIISVSFSQRVTRNGVRPVDVSKNGGKREAYNYKIEQFYGRWQEIERVDATKTPLSFSDTTYLDITDSARAFIKQGASAKMIGEVFLDHPGNILMAVSTYYKIIKADQEQMILSEDDGVLHSFKKVDFFWKDRAQLDLTEPILINPAGLVGKWFVYKKQSAVNSSGFSGIIINKLEVIDPAGKVQFSGNISFLEKGNTKQLSFLGMPGNKALLISAEKYKWSLTFYKVDQKEIIFSDESGVKYFAKKI